MRPTTQMRFRLLARSLPAVLPTLTVAALAQFPAKPSAAIPATPATSSFTSAAPAVPVTHPVRPAEVTFASGLLTVSAANSSLNQILREIARATGMKITGTVREDRVFGTYGPAAPSDILATLLDGTGSNMLLVQKTDGGSSELFLTPRTGGVSPPDPNAAARQEAEMAEQPEPPPPPQPQPQLPPQQRVPINPINNARDGASPVDTTARPGDTSTPSSQSIAFPSITAGSTQSTGTTSTDNTQQPADGVKTPQQIFEQLQRMRQQQNTNANPR